MNKFKQIPTPKKSYLYLSTLTLVCNHENYGK